MVVVAVVVVLILVLVVVAVVVVVVVVVVAVAIAKLCMLLIGHLELPSQLPSLKKNYDHDCDSHM